MPGLSLQLNEALVPLRDAEQGPDRHLRRIGGIAARAALTQGNALVGFLLNLLLPWDLFHSHQLNLHSRELAQRLPRWTEAFVQLDEWQCLAHFAALNPDYSYPSFLPSDAQQP
ncbi:hypothetical protein RZS08_24590, partial [Arthrospira platensis SPKY1]|nr:hypothetical protein [Arthrospira platensis SPKY1]